MTQLMSIMEYRVTAGTRLWPARRMVVDRGAPRVRVTVVDRLDEIEAEWLDFQGRAHGTFYQSYQWCRAWQDMAGAAGGVRPRIVVGRDPAGTVLFLLPFGLYRRHG